MLSTRVQRVASLQMRRRVVQMAHGEYRRLCSFAILMHDVKAKDHKLCKLEIVQHGGVHELQRACRHVDCERRPHAGRRREQRQRRRSEGQMPQRARFFWTRSGKKRICHESRDT